MYGFGLLIFSLVINKWFVFKRSISSVIKFVKINFCRKHFDQNWFRRDVTTAWLGEWLKRGGHFMLVTYSDWKYCSFSLPFPLSLSLPFTLCFYLSSYLPPFLSLPLYSFGVLSRLIKWPSLWLNIFYWSVNKMFV